MEKLYTVIETAEYLRVHRMTIYNWLKEGKIKSSKIGDNHLIAESEIKRVLKGEWLYERFC